MTTTIAYPSVAALRSRNLSTQLTPAGVPMAGDFWLFDSNSIAAAERNVVPTVVTPAHTQSTEHGAAKQAAPPRGVPR